MALGRDGVGELVFLIAGYGLIAMLVNAFDVPVPGADAWLHLEGRRPEAGRNGDVC